MKINLPDKLYYSIGEVAKAFDVNTSLIRYWEQEFLSLNLKKTGKETDISLLKISRIFR
jgi:DNA-binding transcriptional MerR regulator